MPKTEYCVSDKFPGGGSEKKGPFLLPPGSPDEPQALSIWVASVCSGEVSSDTTGIPAGGVQPDFGVEFRKPTEAQAPFYAKVTVRKDNLFADHRDAIKRSFRIFRQQTESLEKDRKLIPGGSDLLIQRVASALPLPFDETLLFHYGLDYGDRVVNLIAGMTLRIDFGAYQYVDAADAPGSLLNGFVGQGSSFLQVTRRSDLTLALDPFLGVIGGFSLDPPSSCPGMVGGVADLMVRGNARRRLRLLYPKILKGPEAIKGAAANSATGPVLIGADTWQDLDAATDAFLNGKEICGVAQAGNNPVTCLTFGGRTMVVPEITVIGGSHPWRIPLGTTLRGLAQRIFDPAPDQFDDAGGSKSEVNLGLWRWTQPALVEPAKSQDASYRLQKVVFPKTTVSGRCGDSWDLPLLRGDNLTWRLAATQ